MSFSSIAAELAYSSCSPTRSQQVSLLSCCIFGLQQLSRVSLTSLLTASSFIGIWMSSKITRVPKPSAFRIMAVESQTGRCCWNKQSSAKVDLSGWLSLIYNVHAPSTPLLSSDLSTQQIFCHKNRSYKFQARVNPRTIQLAITSVSIFLMGWKWVWGQIYAPVSPFLLAAVSFLRILLWL